MQDSFDIIVIGGGPAGYVAAIRAAQLGAKTAIVERDTLGGTCLNRGCIPTKSYLKTADILVEAKEWKNRGILLDTPPRLDMKAALDCKNKAVRKLTGGVRSLLESNAVAILKGEAVLLGSGRVDISGAGTVAAKSIILAGGSIATKLPIPGAESKRVLVSDEILALDRVPKSLAVIGGGVIGVETAQIFSAFGSVVTIIELADRLLPGMDADLSEAMRKALARRGIAIHTGAGIVGIEERGDGISILLSDGKRVDSELALLSVGRRPDLSCLGASGIATEKGRVVVDEFMKTSVDGVYAPGDINGRKMLAHAAFAMGEAAADTALGYPRQADLRFVPSVVYGRPEMASVGLTEAEARTARGDVEIGVFPLAANGRAVASGETEGFIKMIADAEYGEILGVHMVGANVSELINEASALMKLEATTHETIEICHAHPTFSEAIMEAAAATLGRCIHLPRKD